MSAEEIKRFNEAVTSDGALQEEVKKVGTSLEDLVTLANGKGFDFTLAELKELAASKEGELSEEQLDDVAGGTFVRGCLAVVAFAASGH